MVRRIKKTGCTSVLIGAAILAATVSSDAQVNNVAPLTLIVERSTDPFIAPAEHNYRGLVTLLLQEHTGIKPRLLERSTGPAILQSVESLRIHLAQYDMAASTDEYAALLDSSYLHAARKYFWGNISQALSFEIAAELPEGRPDYRAVTRSNHKIKKTTENRMTAKVIARPSVLPDAGQLTLWTKLEFRRNTTNPELPKTYFGSVLVMSKALGAEGSDHWFADDQKNYKAFIRCATAETMHILRLSLEGNLTYGKRRERLQRKGYFTPVAEKRLEYAAPFNPIEKRDHRVRLGYEKKMFGSFVPDEHDISGGAPMIGSGPGLEECVDEPGASSDHSTVERKP